MSPSILKKAKHTMKNLPMDLKVHVVSHTHWDREWRQPFEFFQPYLVKCFEHLFDIFKSDPKYKSFLLDGQAVMLDDYLEVCPERAKDVRRWLKKGRIFAGPWYSLIDNNLVAGESVIRNLLYGIRTAQASGAVMMEGYLISSFGHCAQMPQIFAGLGIMSIIFSRGISEWQTKSELIWESPDGTQALAFHLPDRYTKSNWFYLVHRPGCVGRDAMDWSYRWPADNPMHACDAASADHYWWRTQEAFLRDRALWVRCVENLIEKALAVSSVPILLAMDGVDHIFPHRNVPDIIRTANEHFGREVLVHSNLPAYIADVRAYLKKKGVKLEVKRGEMRRPIRVPGFNQLLAGTISARMNMKLLNHAAETSLIRLAEPLCTLAWLNGARYPKPFIDRAWKTLMVNHAHDGICGTSVDAVHDAMADRYVRARNIADFVAYEALKDIVLKIDTSHLAEREILLTVFNTTCFSRSRVVRAVVDVPYIWKPAGLEICDMKGRHVPFVLKTKQKEEREILADHEAQLGFLCLRVEVDFLTEDLPAFGYKSYIVRPGIWQNPGAPAKVGRFATARQSATAQIENEYLRVKAESDGSLTITDKRTGRIYSGLNVFSSSGDVGDSTTFVPPMGDFTAYSTGAAGAVEVAETGPLYASLRVTRRMVLPVHCEPKAKNVELVETAQPFKAHRSSETVEEVITSTITLECGAQRVEIKTVVDNVARDHRLRVLFPSGAKGAKTWVADAPFDVIERDISLPDTHDWTELWPETQPISSWFAVSDDKGGLAILTKGIPEAACLDDESRTLALTLLRCTRRSIGEDYSLEGSQCPGRHVFEYAIQPFEGNWKSQGLTQGVADFMTPLRAILSASQRKGKLPDAAEYLNLQVKPAKASGNIGISCVKKSEEGNSMIIRLWNPTLQKVLVRLELPKPWRKAQAVLSNEVCKANIPCDKNGYFTLAPFKIATFRFLKK